MRKNKLLLLLALLLTAATGAWGMQIYISYPSWPTGTNVNGDGNLVLEMEASDSFENMKAKIEDKSGLNPDYMKLYFNSVEMANNETLNAKGVTSNSVLTLVYTLYNVTMKDGVKDADKWTITPAEATTTGVAEGTKVTLQYNGRLKVKGVKATSDAGAPAANIVDLSKLTADYEAQDGDVLTGTLAGNYKISIADGATVTLDGVTINGTNDENYEWAGITCLGDATIILSGTNTVKGFYEDYPGIQAAAGKTLIINGTGSLTASSYDYAAAIGGGNGVACGNIEIQGGTITATSVGLYAGIGGGRGACGNITISGGTVSATGGEDGAGIGGGYNASWGNITISGGNVTAIGGQSGAGIGGGKIGIANVSCGNITISGGTVNATGGADAAGIGGGRGNNNKYKSSCGDITITTGVTKVTATMGDGATNSIGAGKYGTCGTVTIGGTKYWENNAAVNGGDTYLAQATIEYPAPAKTPATVTTAPTGAAVVGVGKTTALVSGGVADGGTLMYAVTTTDTKPTSTDGFSDAVPTAKDITASGTVYVWYYVKADATHTDSEISATAIAVTVMAVPITVTWNPSDIVPEHSWDESFTKDGITITAATCDFQIPSFWGGGTFTTTIGNFTKIEISADYAGDVSGTGWSNDGWQSATWTGNAASVSFSGDIWGGGMTCDGGKLTIVFTIE